MVLLNEHPVFIDPERASHKCTDHRNHFQMPEEITIGYRELVYGYIRLTSSEFRRGYSRLTKYDEERSIQSENSGYKGYKPTEIEPVFI